MQQSITKEKAIELCEVVRMRNKRKLLSFGKIQCIFCWKFGTKKDNQGEIIVHNICAFNDGCYQVSKLDKDLQKT